MGRDVFAQFVWGARPSLAVGFATGLAITALGTVIGLIAGYFGGRTDAVLDLLTNAVLVIPNIPLLILLASFAGTVGPLAIMAIITLTSWPWGARMTRAQTLALKQPRIRRRRADGGRARLAHHLRRDRAQPGAADRHQHRRLASSMRSSRRRRWSIFGFGDPLNVTWGTMLYNAQNSSAIIIGAWWDIGAPAVGIALVGLGLALLNFTFDEIANPQLRSGPALSPLAAAQPPPHARAGGRAMSGPLLEIRRPQRRLSARQRRLPGGQRRFVRHRHAASCSGLPANPAAARARSPMPSRGWPSRRPGWRAARSCSTGRTS